MPAMSSVGPDAFCMMSDIYLPTPSCVIPRCTETPVCGTSSNFTVLFGLAKIASDKSIPTLPASMSNAATKFISPTPYSPKTGCISPGISLSFVASAYFATPCTRDDAQFPTPIIATLMLPNLSHSLRAAAHSAMYIAFVAIR